MTHIFILNPYAGIRMYTDDLRQKLEYIPDLDYFILGVRDSDDEAEVVRRALDIFEGEKLRFYVCGGSGTFQKVLDGFDNLSDVEVAYFPCGIANGFLKNFGEDASRFENVEELIHGDVIDIDYIKTNHGVCVNSFSFGFDSHINSTIESVRPFRSFGTMVPYNIALWRSLTFSGSLDVNITTDDGSFYGKTLEGFFGNGAYLTGGLCMGETSLTDGLGNIVLLPSGCSFGMLSSVRQLRRKNTKFIEKKNMLKSVSTKIEVSSRNNHQIYACLDGNVIVGDTKWTAEIVHKGLHLVVPKGVKL